jgi:hypothetical protein
MGLLYALGIVRYSVGRDVYVLRGPRGRYGLIIKAK